MALLPKRIVIVVEVEQKVLGDQDALFEQNKDAIHERVEQMLGGYGFNVRTGQSSVQFTYLGKEQEGME